MIRLETVQAKDRGLLYSINQKYLYEMTNFYDDQMDSHGNYHYGHFEEYFTDPGRKAYLIYNDKQLVGFAFLCPCSDFGAGLSLIPGEISDEKRDEPEGLPNGWEPDFVMAEFTIFPAFRRKHYAMNATKAILDRHPGRWEIKCNEKNLAGKALWTAVTAPYHPEIYHLNEEETVFVFSNENCPFVENDPSDLSMLTDENRSNRNISGDPVFELFDTHAHYDHPWFEDGAAVVRQLYQDGVINGVVIPAIRYESNYHREMFPAEEFPYVYFAPGLHPKHATNEVWWDATKRAEFEALLQDPRTVALKTGLDFAKEKLTDAQKEHQTRFFKYFIRLANERKLPLVLHVRDAAWEAIEMLRGNPIQVEAVVHCFCYDLAVAREMMQVGVTRFGIGGKLTKEDMGDLRLCVKELPMSAILLETDAPFVKPEGYEEKLNTSVTMMGTARLIAE